MKIALLSPLEEQVPPRKYGGTELVVYNLAQQLVKKGHDVTLFASGDSKTNAKLFPVYKKAIRVLPEAQDPKCREVMKLVGLGKVLEQLKKSNFDIIHNHIGWRVLSFAGLFDTPMVTTLHGPLTIPYQQFVYNEYANANYISISLAQRKPLPHLHFVGNVYNGIDVKEFSYSATPKDYVAFLGRMSPEKGPLQAIEIAKKAGVKLKMAAKIDASDQEFYETKVRPQIDGDQIEFVGEIGPKEKSDFLKNAKALLAPIQWEEPFGLYFVEAMACGTPVISVPRGSAPEVILDKKTGYLCKDVATSVKKLKQIDKIDRAFCRKHVEEVFSSENMSDGYLKVYNEVLNTK